MRKKGCCYPFGYVMFSSVLWVFLWIQVQGRIDGDLETQPSKLFQVKLRLAKASNEPDDLTANSTRAPVTTSTLSRAEELGRFFRGPVPMGTDFLTRYFTFRYDNAGKWTLMKGELVPIDHGSMDSQPHFLEPHHFRPHYMTTTARPVRNATTGTLLPIGVPVRNTTIQPVRSSTEMVFSRTEQTGQRQGNVTTGVPKR